MVVQASKKEMHRYQQKVLYINEVFLIIRQVWLYLLN